MTSGLAQCESRALARLQYVLDLLDKFVEPSELASAPIHSGHQAPGRLIPAPRPSPSGETRGSLAVRMLGAFELTIDGQRVTDWRGQRTQSLMQFLTAHRHRSVVRDELIVAVWPDVDEDNGRHRLHQAVYELRRILALHRPRPFPNRLHRGRISSRSRGTHLGRRRGIRQSRSRPRRAASPRSDPTRRST